MKNFIDPNLPGGEIEGAWDKVVKNLTKLSSERKNNFEIIIVGCGLSGSSAAATLAEEGFKIKLLTYHDSPRRAHSVSAQGGINAARSFLNEGRKDAIDKLFQVLVVGGVTLGAQACAKKGAPETVEPTNTSEEAEESTETNEAPAESKDLNSDNSRTLVNSNGDKCEDICTSEESGEVFCDDPEVGNMCCWLMAVECCPNYRGLDLEEAEETDEDKPEGEESSEE